VISFSCDGKKKITDTKEHHKKGGIFVG